MSTSAILRIAAIVAFLFFAGHTAGVPWTPGSEAKSTEIANLLKSLPVPDIEPARTYWDFYFGFGLSISVYLCALAVLLWQTASLSIRYPSAAKPIMLTLFLSYLFVGILAAKFFFAIPAVSAALVCILIAIAWLHIARGGSVA